MRRGDVAPASLFQPGARGAPPSPRQCCQRRRIRCPTQQRFPHGTGRGPPPGGDHRRPLEVGVLKDCWATVGAAGTRRTALGALAGAVAQVALGGAGMQLPRSRP
jgi:hypothetical protein